MKLLKIPFNDVLYALTIFGGGAAIIIALALTMPKDKRQWPMPQRTQPTHHVECFNHENLENS